MGAGLLTEVTERTSKWGIQNKEGGLGRYSVGRAVPGGMLSASAPLAGWWYKPDFVINDLNINSAITTPRHDEVLVLHHGGRNKPYKVCGFAYTRGGHKIIRVEISLNNEQSWRLAEIRRFEEPNEYGAHLPPRFGIQLEHCCGTEATRACKYRLALVSCSPEMPPEE
jgi:hypothetical protein